MPLTATADPFGPDTMHRHGYYSGHEDALAGTWSEPIEAEDGTDYAVGYRQGHSDGLEALAQHRA